MNEVKKILRRLSIFYWLVFMLGIMITGQIILLQFFSPNLKAPGVRSQKIDAVRGNILTHDGRVLATSRLSYKLYMDFRTPALKKVFTNENVKELSKSLANFFKDKSAEKYEQELNSANNTKAKRKEIGSRDVNYLEYQEIRKFAILKNGRNTSGLIPDDYTERIYPYLSFARRTIGNMREGEGKKVGNKGIEGYYEKYLSGTPGERMEHMSSQGWIPITSEDDKLAENGYDVVTTLDINIQDAVEVALINQLKKSSTLRGGTAVVMEVETGEIRAIANISSNPNGTFSENYNYAISERSDPGSTFKLATLIALLEDKHITLNTNIDTGNGSFTCRGKTYRDLDGPHGNMTVLNAFKKSSNVAFAKLVLQHYKSKDEWKKFVKHFQDMGLDSQINIDIEEEENKPHIPHPDKNGWSGLSLTQTAVGYEVSLAPIHTLTLFNAVANNGKMVKPKFVTEIQKHGQTIKTIPTEVMCSAICSSSTLKEVKIALETVVKEGSAKHINSKLYQIAGKTGTARMPFSHSVTKRIVYEEKIGNDIVKVNQPSFAGYFPAHNPKYSVIVVLYTKKSKENYHGGRWAAPIFKEIADKIYASHPEWHDRVTQPDVPVDLPIVKGGKGDDVNMVLSKLNIPIAAKVSDANWVKTKIVNGKIEIVKAEVKETVPSVVNMGLKDALYILENMGLHVQYTGKGIVKKQSIQSGSKVVKGQTISLILEV